MRNYVAFSAVLLMAVGVACSAPESLPEVPRGRCYFENDVYMFDWTLIHEDGNEFSYPVYPVPVRGTNYIDCGIATPERFGGAGYELELGDGQVVYVSSDMLLYTLDEVGQRVMGTYSWE